jgi:hypothetical protein
MSPMVLTRSELIGTLQQEVRILVHLAGKVDAWAGMDMPAKA